MGQAIHTAVMLVLVFKTSGDVEEEKLASNHRDIENFLKTANAYDESGFKAILNSTDIKLYFKELIL